MTYSRTLTAGFSRGSGIFPVGVNKGGIEGRVLRIDILKEIFAHMDEIKRTLLDISLGHGHGSGCAMCRLVLGDSTTVRRVNLPSPSKPTDVAKSKKELEDTLGQYLTKKKYEPLPNLGSLIIVMRPSSSNAATGLENIDSSEDETDFQEVIYFV